MSDQPIIYAPDAATGVATITLNRPERRNAQNRPLLEALDRAWSAADADDSVRVVLLNANGPHFSAGHDLKEAGVAAEITTATHGIARLDARERDIYLGLCLKWRDMAKPSVAAVQGHCMAGGLMLAWPCDLIVAAEDAMFTDPVVAMGVGSVEYHGHPWEFGIRRAKEMLFTGDPVTAAEARALGAVNRVVPVADLQAAARRLAEQIATRDPFALKMAKRMTNRTQDAMGFRQAVEAAFDMQMLCHAQALAVTGDIVRRG